MSIAHMTDDLSYLVFFKAPSGGPDDPRELLYASLSDLSAGLLVVGTAQPNRAAGTLISNALFSLGVGKNYLFEMSTSPESHAQYVDWLRPGTLQAEEISDGTHIDFRTRSTLIQLPEAYFQCTYSLIDVLCTCLLYTSPSPRDYA